MEIMLALDHLVCYSYCKPLPCGSISQNEELKMSYEAALKNEAKGAEAPDKPAGKKTRAKTEETAKTYPQFNEDGTPKLGADGQQEWGPTKMARPKKARKPREVQYEKNEDGTDKLDAEGNKIPVPKKARTPRKVAVNLVCNGEVYDLRKSQNDTTLEVLGTITSREGSKRNERAKAFEGAATVQDFFIKGGVVRDLNRHVKSGAVKLTFGGHPVTVAEPAPVATEEAAPTATE